MKGNKGLTRRFIHCVAWLSVAALAFAADKLVTFFPRLPSGLSLLQLIALVAGIMATCELAGVCTSCLFVRKHRPPVEAAMIGRIYWLIAALAIVLIIAYGLGQLASFGSFFSLFGGMLLGWSLQAPVSGFAAWVLVLLKRPFRPGDRVQLPNLGLTGDVEEVGVMYTVLNQVGGAVGSEEAVGRHILVPNAMLFSQVVINYTVLQEAAYMLDEVVVRITYDSDWKVAEQILLDAATEVTKDIIEATGEKPYIRSDLYDYGVYMRLRYQTRVKNRAEIAYEINKRIFHAIQRTSCVDLAIPYVYSYRAGAERKEVQDKEHNVQDIELGRIRVPELHRPTDAADIEQLAQSIATQGLLQPIVVAAEQDGHYDLLAGHLRLEACRRLGWTTIPALVQDRLEEAKG